MQQKISEPETFQVFSERIRIGRAKRDCRCDACRETIIKGEPRITLDGRFFEYRCDRHYHIDCKIDELFDIIKTAKDALRFIRSMFALE